MLPAHLKDIIIFVDVEAIFTDPTQIFLNSVRWSATAAQCVVHSQPLIEGGHLDDAVELPDHRGVEGDDDLVLHQALNPVELPGVVVGLEEVEG